MPIAELVVNSLLPSLFSAEDAAQLERVGALEHTTPARAVLDSGVRRAVRERIQNESLTRLAALGVPLRKLDLLLGGAATPPAIAQLAKQFG